MLIYAQHGSWFELITELFSLVFLLFLIATHPSRSHASPASPEQQLYISFTAKVEEEEKKTKAERIKCWIDVNGRWWLALLLLLPLPSSLAAATHCHCCWYCAPRRLHPFPVFAQPSAPIPGWIGVEHAYNTEPKKRKKEKKTRQPD